jgi:hypothetical protein
MSDSQGAMPAVEALARQLRLYRWVHGVALALGGGTGLVLFFLGVFGLLGRGTEGMRNPALLVLLVAPLAVTWGTGTVVYRLLRRRIAPADRS